MAAFTEGFEDTRGSVDHFGAVVSKVMQARRMADEEKQRAEALAERNQTSLEEAGIEMGHFFKAALFRVWFEHSKLNDNIVVHTRRDYTNRIYAFPANAAEKQIASLQWRKKKRPKSQIRENWIDRIEQVYEMISADDAAWIRTLIDHTDQEIDFSFVFNAAGALDDVLIYKREAKNFKSFRP